MVQIGAYTPHGMQMPAAGSGLEQDVARTREALGIANAHRAVAATADPGDPTTTGAGGEDHDAGITTPLAYTAAGRIREASVRPRVSIVV